MIGRYRLTLPKTQKREHLSGRSTSVVTDKNPRAWKWEFSLNKRRVLVCGILGGNQKLILFSTEKEMYIYLSRLLGRTKITNIFVTERSLNHNHLGSLDRHAKDFTNTQRILLTRKGFCWHLQLLAWVIEIDTQRNSSLSATVWTMCLKILQSFWSR